MPANSDFRTGRHVEFKLHAYLVFIPKYRRACITESVATTLGRVFEVVCTDFECELLDFKHAGDHVQLRVAYPPKVALSTLVNSLKGVSARRLRALRLPELSRALPGNAFWSPSYCAISCGAPVAIIREYVAKERLRRCSS